MDRVQKGLFLTDRPPGRPGVRRPGAKSRSTATARARFGSARRRLAPGALANTVPAEEDRRPVASPTRARTGREEAVHPTAALLVEGSPARRVRRHDPRPGTARRPARREESHRADCRMKRGRMGSEASKDE